MTFNIPADTTIGSVKVVTQGVTGLDFQYGSDNCTTSTFSTAGSCIVNVVFAPLAPGLRAGAVELFDTSSPANLLATTPIYGIGEGPAVAFSPGTQTTVNTGSYSLTLPNGVAVDAAGDIFIADGGDGYNGKVVEVPANGTATSYNFTLEYPQGLAVDGAGDLFIADNNRNLVVEVPAGCTSNACEIDNAFGLNSQLGVAVDGAGDLFVSSYGEHEVVEVPANGGAQTVVYDPATGSGPTSNPIGMAVNAAGDLFVADFGLKQVVEITPTGVQTTVGTGWVEPEAVAVDAAGDVFVADETLGEVEVPAGCSNNSACQITISNILAYGVAVDAKGDVFLPERNGTQVAEISRSQPPSLNFPTATTVGLSDVTDGANLVTLQNAGNTMLSFPVPLSDNNPSIGADFSLFSNGQGDCPLTTASSSSPGTLAVGASCVYSVTFDPIAAGTLNESLVLTDNNLNAISPSPAATQTVALSGTGLAVNYSLAASTAGSGSGILSGTNCSTGTYPTGTTVTCTETAAAGSLFTGWSGGTCSGTGSCSFTLGSNSSVVANFSLAYALTVTDVGTGLGSVTSNSSASPAISCAIGGGSVTGTCSEIDPSGAQVTLTASATGSSTFVGWGGACASAGASATCNVTVSAALAVSASFVAPGPSQSGMLKPITAGIVYGQGGSFTTGTANTGGVSANSLQALGGVVADANGNLYVADGGNNRVLFYPAGSTTPTRVYGQGGSFTTGTANSGGVSATSLADPQGLALDSSGNLYVADESNNRVLFYLAGSTTATRVYGQGGAFTTNTWNNGGVSANSLGEPYGLAVDSSGNLYVGDYQNNRVLFYPAGSTTATQVYGQNGSFTTNSPNMGGVPSANSLNQPTGVALDSSGDLYVADIYNNRVLVFPYNSTVATQVYGQGGSFTSSSANTGAGGLNNPMYVALDSSGDLYVVDRSNNRALFYPFGSTTATRVYGQLSSFTSGTANNGGISADSFSQPWAVALDPSGNLYVTDYSNNRVLEYGSFGNVNVCPADAITPAPCNSTVTLSDYVAATTNFGVTQVVTQGASGLDFSLASGGTCTGTAAEGSSCTVNVNFAPLAPGLRMGAVSVFDNGGNLVATTPIYGIGQAPEAAFAPGTQTTVPASGLDHPVGVALDGAGNLFVASYGNGIVARNVEKVTPGGVQTTVPTSGLIGPIGVAVDGAGDLFIVDYYGGKAVKVTPSGVQTTVATGLSSPIGLALDGAGDAFIADQGNNRVVKVTPGGAQTTVPVSGLSQPWGVAVDASGDVFIADGGINNRVVEVTPSGVQTTVPTSGLSQPLSQPYDLAVDAAGDVFIADPQNARVVEVPYLGSGTYGNPSTVPTTGLNYPSGVAVDAAGDVFIGDQGSGEVFEVNRSQPPSLSFALTNQYSTSTDSPQSISVQNVGNQPLTGPPAGPLVLSLGGNFTQNLSPDCSTIFPLAPGVSCSESFSFTPQTTGYLAGTAAFSDNTLNLSSSVVLQTINLSGNGGLNGLPVAVAVPNVVGLTQEAATTAITGAGLSLGTVSTASSSVVLSGSVSASNPVARTQVSFGSEVRLLVSTGPAPPTTPNPLSFENNYFVTGDFASAGVVPQLRGTGVGGIATGTITIADSTTSPSASQGVPDGADIIDAFLYWETLEDPLLSPSGGSGTFDNYPITGQQIGSDLPYTDGSFSGTLRVYRADVNTYFPAGTNGVRFASGTFTVSLPDGGAALPLAEGASLVVIYRVLSPNFPLKSVVIYDGSAIPATSTTQNMQGFYDAAGSGESTTLFDVPGGGWNNSSGSAMLAVHASQFSAPLNAGNAYAAVILSTPVSNSNGDGVLDAWKAGPAGGDFYAGQPGYYDVKTGSWVPLPGAAQGEKDLFVQLDYMCGAVLSNGSCDPSQENLFPSPDAQGNDPLAMVTNAFAAINIHLHLEIGNAVPEDTCYDNTSATPPQLCQFPSVQGAVQPGVISWKNSLEFSKLWPRNLASCAAGGDCSPRFPYGQKDSYHYVLFGHSLAIPAWNSRYGSLVSINVVSGVTTIVTTDRGTGINYCPSRITISGVLSNPSLNGVYNTTGCANSSTITVSTPGVANWSYNYSTNTPPEPVIGLTSGTVTSISGYSDLGGSDSAVTLGLWETAPNQDMSKRANVIAGTLFHEIGHTLGLSHGGLYYDGGAGSYIPTFDVNCKPNYQSVMNYLFQLDGVGPNSAVAFSNQQLDVDPVGGPPVVLNDSSLTSGMSLTDAAGNPATFSTSAWYTPTAPSSTASAATMHCDGTPLTGDTGYRVDGPIAPIAPAWSSGQNITFDGVPYTTLRGYNDVANIDLRQVGATGGEFASLASVLSFGSTSTPLNIGAGGNVTLGSGGTVTLGSGGNMTLGSGGNVTLGSGGTITLGSGGNVTLGSGGNVTLGSGGTVTPGSGGTVSLGSGGTVTLSSSGTITLDSGGTVILGSGGTVTLGSGGTIALGSGGNVTIPSSGGSYTIDSLGGTITLGSGGNVTLGSGGNVTLGSGGIIAMGSGGTVTLGSGGNITLGSGGIIAMGSGGTIALGSGGNVTLGSGGTIALGSGGTITMGSGGNVTLGSGGTVTQGDGGGDLSLGSGGTVTLGSGGTATVGAGGTVTLGSGGTIALGSGGNVTLGSGGTVTPTGGNPVPISAGGSYTFGSSGGTVALGSGGTVTLGSGGNVTLGSGGVIAMGSGGTVALGSGGNVALGSGGTIALGSGGTVALGSGGNIALGSGGNVTLGSGGATTNEVDYLTANSVVRPPSSPTETPMMTSPGTPVVVNWTAPTFGVVATYTISRGSELYAPFVIGSVSGVGGNPPATTFTDTNPDLTSHMVAYTISTSLLPVPIDPTARQSIPSPPAVMTNDQTIVLGPPPLPTLPSSVSISTSPLTVYATAESNNAPNGLQVNFSASSATGSCSIVAGSESVGPVSNGTGGASSATVALNSTGNCTITASQPGTNLSQPGNPPYYNSANSVSGTFTILPANSTTQAQTISFASLPNVQYGSTFSVGATASLPVSFTASGPCTVGATTGMATGAVTGVGLCKITASAPAGTVGTNTYSAASLTHSFNILPAPLTVMANSFTIQYGQALPALTPSLGVTYTLSGFVNNGLGQLDTASVVSGAPGLSTTAATGSSAGSYPITVSTGTLAAANYSFIYANGTLTINAAPVITVSPSMINFGAVAVGSITTQIVTVSNTGDTAATISTPIVSLLKASNSNEFVVVNFCLSSLAAGKSCTITVSFVAGAYYNTPQTAMLEVQDNAPGSPQGVALNATILMPQTITLTGVPTTAAYNSSFTVAATGGASGNAVIFTSSGGCSITGTTPGTATYTMTSGKGTCSVIANQAGNSSYAAAPQVTKTVNATQAAQTITFTTNAPPSAGNNTSFTVAASAYSGNPAAANGNAVTFTSSGVCNITGTTPGTATYKMTSGKGTCSVIANQAGNSNYTAAPQVTESVTATLASQTIVFTISPPASAAYKSTFKVAATGGASGNAVTFTSSGACSNSGATYTMTSGTGTCSVIANQAGDSNYAAATQITQPVSATPVAQAITFTTNPPASAAYKSTFKVAATGGASGNAVTFTSSGACSNSGATYTMTSGTGTCSVIASQAGNSNYTAAPQVTESVNATLVAQTITFTTNPPATAALNSSFKVAATGGASGNAVTFTSSGACSNSGVTYTMTSGTGTCSVIANQAANSNYAAAPQVTKTATAKQ